MVLLERLTEEGFQIVCSRHNATNNAVLIPKLRAGFIISSLEISDMFGTLVHLRYYTNPTRRAVMGVRSGEVTPVGDLAWKDCRGIHLASSSATTSARGGDSSVFRPGCGQCQSG